jgi:hypothetical protein
MGKKDRCYDQKIMDSHADGLERYLEMIDSYLILTDTNEKEYANAIAEIKEAIKNLRKGKGHKAYREEEYMKYYGDQ